MTTPDCRHENILPPSAEQIAANLRLLHAPGSLVELRALRHGKAGRTLSGIFDDMDKLAAAARMASLNAASTYVTLNPVVGSFDSGRSLNADGYGLNSAGASHIDRRRWLLVDVDPSRPAGLSATDAEKAAAADVSDAVEEHLRHCGWPAPILADSGNGFHQLYRIDRPADPSDVLVRRCLAALAAKFDTPAATIDRAVHDLPRLVKVYGTASKKGDDTPERPWRTSGIISAPGEGAQVVPDDLLEGLAASVLATPARRDGTPLSAPPGQAGDEGLKPGDDFDQRGPDWEDILGPHGWQLLTLRGTEGRWRRPGKNSGDLSATTGHCRGGKGEPLFRVFSSNAAPFQEGEAYGKFRAYAMLNHNSDLSAAASALAAMGYGSNKSRRVTAAPPRPLAAKEASGTPGHRFGEPGGGDSTPAVTAEQRKASKKEAALHLDVTTFDEYDVEPVRWLVPDRIPSGMISIVAGEGGGGKTTATLSLAAALSRGVPAFGMDYPDPPRADTLVIACEDDVRRTTKPRLLAMGADMARVANLNGTADESGKVRPWSLSAVNLEALDLYLAGNPRTKLVIIDPVTAFVGATGADDHRDSEIRSLLSPLSELAGKRDVAVVLIMHLNKATGVSAVGRILGSVGYVNTARMAFVVARDPDDETRQLMVPCKQNISALKTGIAFSLDPLPEEEALEIAAEHGAGLEQEDRARLAKQLFRPTWRGECDTIADDVVAPRRPKGATGEVGRCSEWLKTHLTPNARKAEDVAAAAEQAGFTEATLERAKRALKQSDGLVNKPIFSRGPWWLGLGPCEAWQFATEMARAQT